MSVTRFLRRLIPVEFQPRSDAPKLILSKLGYFRLRTRVANGGQNVPDIGLYRPLFSPWYGLPEFEPFYELAKPHTLVSRDRCYILWRTIRQAMRVEGDFLECGVFRGGTALLEARAITQYLPDAIQSGRKLRLFDSFQGMPPDTADAERFSPGDFARTSVDAVSKLLAPYPIATLHPGFIPDTFGGLDVPKIAWAHVDVDLHQSVRDCIAWIYPRLTAGGFMIFDDYGFPSCSGARRAVDDAFADKPEVPICLPTGQCMVVKLPSK